MSYDAQKEKFGKRAVQFVELHLERCGRTYGTAPCTAAIGTTGTKKCFNTFATCQDSANFLSSSTVYRFSTTQLFNSTYGPQQVGEAPTFPTLMSVNTAPTVLTPGKGLGVRSSVSCVIQDHPWTDAFTDPYRADRLFNPDNQGTFWSKFLARNRYYQNRKLVVYTGFLDDNGDYDPANFKSRTYVITKISGPGANGSVTIEAKDPLRLADNEKVKFPAPSRATLLDAINASHPHFRISDPDDAVKTQLQIGTLAQPYLRVDREIVRVTSFSITGTHEVTVDTVRAGIPTFYDGTFNVAVSHDVGVLIQTTWLFENAKAYDVVYKLLHDAATLDAAYLPYSEWVTEIENGFQWMQFSRLIAEPTGVKDLLTEITEHGVMLWWDERSTVVRMRGMRFYSVLDYPINDTSNLIANSVSVSEDPNNLATELWISYSHSCPLEDPKQLKSYRLLDVGANLAEEGVNAYGRGQTLSIRSTWMPAGGGVSYQRDVLLRQYSRVRKIISFALDPKDDNYWVGDVVSLATHLVQDDEGLAAARNYLLTSVDEIWGADGVTLKYTATEQFSFSRVGVIAPNTLTEDYSAASPATRNGYAFISRDIPIGGPTFTDGTPAYQIT